METYGHVASHTRGKGKDRLHLLSNQCLVYATTFACLTLCEF